MNIIEYLNYAYLLYFLFKKINVKQGTYVKKTFNLYVLSFTIVYMKIKKCLKSSLTNKNALWFKNILF